MKIIIIVNGNDEIYKFFFESTIFIS